jgi:hypothetical protein
MHKTIITAISVFASFVHGQEWTAGSFSTESNPISRISQALVESKVDELTPTLSLHADKVHRSSYHLSSVRYLGGVSRGDQRFTVASVLFIRSSPEGVEQPPARAHGFLLMLDQEYRIASYCRIDFPDQIELLGAKLYRVGKLPFEGERSLIGDLDSAEMPSRSRGFLIDGDAFFPYPFSDRIEPSNSKPFGEQDAPSNGG